MNGSLFDYGHQCPFYTNSKFNCANAQLHHPGRERWGFDLGGGCNVRAQVHAYVNAMHNRTLWLLGDSLMFQLGTAIACRLRAEKLPASPLLPYSHCYLRAGGRRSRVCHGQLVYYASHSRPSRSNSTCDMDENLRSVLGTPTEPGLATENDTVVLNIGVHFVPSYLEEGVKKLSQLVQCVAELHASATRNSSLPSLLWRETPAQHFPNSNGVWFGGYVKALAKAWPRAADPQRPCNSSLDAADERRANILNRKFEPLLRRVRDSLPVVRLWAATAMRGDDHLGIWRNSASGGYDCTHKCEPSSVMEVETELILAFVSAAAQMREISSSNQVPNREPAVRWPE